MSRVAITYTLLAVKLLLVLPISVSALPATQVLRSPAFYVAVIATLSIASTSVRELRRDAHQLCVFWIVLGPILSIAAVIWTHDQPWLGWPALVLFTSTWLASVFVVVFTAWRKTPTSSPILRLFAASELVEIAGVQAHVDVRESARAATGEIELRVHLQNCWDRERTVRPRLSSGTGLLATPGGVRFEDEQTTLTLAPGEFGVWILPAQVITTRRASIFIDLEISGLDGRRIHRVRVPSLPMRVSPLVTVLVAIVSFGTFWVWGGGLRVEVPGGARTVGDGTRVRRWFSLAR